MRSGVDTEKLVGIAENSSGELLFTDFAQYAWNDARRRFA